MLFLLDLTRSWSLDFTELLLVLTESAWEGIFKYFFFLGTFCSFLEYSDGRSRNSGNYCKKESMHFHGSE